MVDLHLSSLRSSCGCRRRVLCMIRWTDCTVLPRVYTRKNSTSVYTFQGGLNNELVRKGALGKCTTKRRYPAFVESCESRPEFVHIAGKGHLAFGWAVHREE